MTDRLGTPLVIFVHGLGRSARDFDAIGAALHDAWPWIAVDLPHHGARAGAVSDDAPATLRAFADVVVDVARASGAEHVALVGHSLGAAVCVEAARALGPQVVHVVALDSLLNPRVYPRQAPPIVAASRLISRVLHPLLARLLARALLPAPRSPALLRDVVHGLVALPARVAAEASADLAAWDRDAALAACTVPITLVPAAPFFRPAVYATLASRCALAGPVAGSHFFLRESPAETADILRAILLLPHAP